MNNTLPLFPSTESEDGFPRLRFQDEFFQSNLWQFTDSFLFISYLQFLYGTLCPHNIINSSHLRSSCPQNRLFIFFGRCFLFLDPKLCFLLICGSSWSTPFHKLHIVISGPVGSTIASVQFRSIYLLPSCKIKMCDN